MAIKGKSGSGTSFLQRGKLIWAVLGIIAIAVFLGSLTLLQSIYQTQTYYVLKADVPTRTQITADMMTPVTTSKGTAPKAAKSLSEAQSGTLYTKYPLTQGDILTNSNVGPFEDISTGVPDNWVITSFNVPADNAVQGRIKRGYYFDMMVSTTTGSSYPFVNVLALDTSVSLSNASSNNAADSEEAKAGQTSVYVVGMPPQDAARLQQIMKKYNNGVQLLLSPRQNEYAAPQLASYTGMFSYDAEKDSPTDLGKGTDNTFTPVERDTLGRPVNKAANCSQGNAKLDEKTCAQQGASPSPSASPSSSASASESPSSTNENENTTTPSASPSSSTK